MLGVVFVEKADPRELLGHILGHQPAVDEDGVMIAGLEERGDALGHGELRLRSMLSGTPAA
jgi:hypothetical protein